MEKGIHPKRFIAIISIAVSLSIIIVLTAYIAKFHDLNISKNPEHWGWFGDFFGGTLNVLFGALNLVLISYLTVTLATRDENRALLLLNESVKPVPYFSFSVSSSSLEITLLNVGLGPLILTHIEISFHDTTYTDFQRLISDITMPARPQYSVGKIHNNDSVVPPKGSLSLLTVKISSDHSSENYQKFKESLQIIKDEISNYEIKITYTDIYVSFNKDQVESLDGINLSCD